MITRSHSVRGNEESDEGKLLTDDLLKAKAFLLQPSLKVVTDIGALNAAWQIKDKISC